MILSWEFQLLLINILIKFYFKNYFAFINLYLRKVYDIFDSQSRDMWNLDRIQLIIFDVLYLLKNIFTFFSLEMILEIYPWFTSGSGGKYTLHLIYLLFTRRLQSYLLDSYFWYFHYSKLITSWLINLGFKWDHLHFHQ